MTEPVAWKILKKSNWRWEIITDDPSNYAYQEVIPLYTEEQLHPRVKMTQAEFDDFQELFEEDADLYTAITEIGDTNLHIALYDRLFTGTDKNTEKQNEFAALWANYNPMEPEETIEIVPDMKWFVRRILPNAGGNMLYCTDEGDLTYNYNKEYATQFDTKEEAEKWTNPLTEAVQLPVEGE